MPANFILIYDKRLEIPNKYKKNIEHSHCATVDIVNNKDDFFSLLVSKEPDLVLISESTKENLSDLCETIREKKLQFRPIVILLSKSNYCEDKTNALNSGADDFWSEPLEPDEFLARIKAHIRRAREENAFEFSLLPNINYTKKVIRRTLKYANNWAMLLIGFDNFSHYKEIYGKVAAGKLFQTYCAILNATLEYDDFAGQIDSDKILIITSSYKADKLADYLNYTFDSIVEKFYSQEDAKRGFILLQGANKAGCKIPLMSTSIGIINSQYISYINEIETINALNKIQRLAKTIPGSSKLTDRPLIASEDPINSSCAKSIVIIEPDEDLAYLLETTMKLQNFEPVIFKNNDITPQDILSGSPDIILIDSSENNANFSINLCKEIKHLLKRNVKIIYTDTAHEKDKVLDAGADLYLPKPYDLMELLRWIYKLLD